MANLLQEQLLKAGLVNEKQVQQARKQSSKAKKGKKAKKGTTQKSEAALLAEQAAREKAERDRELNRQREEERRRQEQRAQLKDFLEHAAVEGKGDVAYNFVEAGRIKRIYVSAEQHQSLSSGHTIITLHGKRHLLLPYASLDKLLEHAPEQWYFRAEPEAKPAEDDPYAGFEVPDDLMW